MDGGLGSSPTPAPGLVLDANVLIDYCQCDRTILSLVSKHVGKVHVPSLVLDEVHELDEDECVRLGLVVVEPELDEVMTTAQRRCGLSFEDHLCLIMAKKRGWICATNDGRLRRECESEGVALLWGLGLMVKLVGLCVLSPDAARDAALLMHSRNPRYITKTVIARFMTQIGSAHRPTIS